MGDRKTRSVMVAFLMIRQTTAAYLIKGFSPIFQFKRFIAVWAKRVIKKTSCLGNS